MLGPCWPKYVERVRKKSPASQVLTIGVSQRSVFMEDSCSEKWGHPESSDKKKKDYCCRPTEQPQEARWRMQWLSWKPKWCFARSSKLLQLRKLLDWAWVEGSLWIRLRNDCAWWGKFALSRVGPKDRTIFITWSFHSFSGLLVVSRWCGFKACLVDMPDCTRFDRGVEETSELSLFHCERVCAIFDYIREVTARISPKQFVQRDVAYIDPPRTGVSQRMFVSILAVVRMVIWTTWLRGEVTV